jgi:hypothetical protein
MARIAEQVTETPNHEFQNADCGDIYCSYLEKAFQIVFRQNVLLKCLNRDQSKGVEHGSITVEMNRPLLR